MTDYRDVLREAPKFYEAYQNGYLIERRSGALNLAYLSGVVNNKMRAPSAVYSDSSYAPIYSNQAKRGIINYGANILIDPYRNMLTALVQNTPGYEVYPTTDDDDKVMVAEKATAVLKYHDDQIFNIKSKMGELYSWATAPVGTAYLALVPEDTDISFPVAGTEDDKSLARDGKAVDEFGRPVDAKISTRKQKRLQCHVLTVWDVACSEDSPDGLIDGCTLQVYMVPTTLREIKRWANPEAVEIIERGLQQRTSVIEDAKTADVRMAKGYPARGRMDILTGDDRQIRVYHVFHKPNDEYRDGWYGIVDGSGTELYWANTLPIRGIMPLTQINTNNMDAGEYIKRSVFDDARGPQVLYQGLFDSRASHAMLAANPPMQRFRFVKTSSDNKQGEYIYPKQGETEVIEFEEPWATAVMQNPPLANLLKPRPMEMTPLNSDVKDLLEECKQVVLNVTGQNLANVGAFPNSNISGASVQEQVSVDAMGQLPMISLTNDFWKRFRTKVLRAVRAYYATEQIAYMMNDDTVVASGKFKLENIDDSYDIKINSTDGLPQTPKGKIEFYAQVMQMAPTPEEKNEAWLRIREIIAGYGLLGEAGDDDEKLAEVENRMLLEDESLLSDLNTMVPMVDSLGQQVMGPDGKPMQEPLARQRVRKWANRFQDEPRHIKVHKPLVTGPDMLTNGPEITQLAAWHIEAHEEIYAIKNKPIMETGNGMGLQAPDVRNGGSGEDVPAGMPEEEGPSEVAGGQAVGM